MEILHMEEKQVKLAVNIVFGRFITVKLSNHIAHPLLNIDYQ